MSKRFVLNTTIEKIKNFFSVEDEIDFNITPNYNISVGDLHPLVINESGKPEIKQAKWGLIPPDAESERAGKENYNYPIEDAENNDLLSKCLQEQRALIPASGFYKWKSTENKSTPFYVRLLSGNIMALGAVYRLWKSPSGRNVYSFALLTDEASALIEPISERKPLVIRPDDFEAWLDKETRPEEILKEVEEYPTTLTEMIVNRVGEEVNDISKNEASLIQPIPK